MKIDLAFDRDEWGRVKLSSHLHSPEPCRVMVYAQFGDKMWRAKGGRANIEHDYSAFYHHVYQGQKRQVIVACGSLIQECVIPAGLDPNSSISTDAELLTPCTLYSNGPHKLGLILIPHAATKSFRNGIWRLKEEYYSSDLLHYKEALSHGRIGHSY